MAAFEIPLSPQPKTFSIPLNGVTYSITLFWNQAVACWMINLANADNVMIIAGIPLVTGIDLLYQYAYLGIGGSLVAQTDSGTDDIPTLTNLGTTSHLFFVTG
jgi:hypothetical protein